MKRTKPNAIIVPREKTPLWRKLTRAAALLLAAARLGLLIAGGFGVQLYIAGIGQRPLLFFLDTLLLLAAAGSIRLRRKIGYAPIFAAVGLLVLIYGRNAFAYERDRSYSELVSPGGAHTLVAEEENSMFSGSARFYEKLGPCFLRKKGEAFSLDDGWQAFRESRSLAWLGENTAEYRGRANGRDYKEIIEF